jgi:hypothetical protein
MMTANDGTDIASARPPARAFVPSLAPQGHSHLLARPDIGLSESVKSMECLHQGCIAKWGARRPYIAATGPTLQ